MATAYFELEFDGDKQFQRELIGRAWRVQNPYPLWNAIADFLTRVEKAEFDTEGAYGTAGGWDPLQPSTLRQKMKKHQDPRILRADGALEASLTNLSDPQNKFRRDRESMTFGTYVPYAKYHQSPRLPRTHLPRRAYINLTALDKKHLERLLLLWVTRGQIYSAMKGAA